jgi:predicted ATP-dependent endonuclease of OLD family
MKVFSLTLRKFRRFDDAWMNLDAPVIAVIGPNEAGKSSFLRALELLNNDEPIPVNDVKRDATPSDVLIESRLRLEADDLTGLPSFDPNSAPIWLIVQKRISGPRSAVFAPLPRRDRSLRIAARRRLRTLRTRGWFRAWLTSGSANDAEATMGILETDPDDYDEASLDSADVFASQLEEISTSNPAGLKLGKHGANLARDIALELRELTGAERRPHPASASASLISSLPLYSSFSATLQSIRSTYNIEDENDFNSPALRLLCAVGEIALEEVRDAIRQENHGRAKSLLDDGSALLSEKVSARWGQAALQVSIDYQASTLRLFVKKVGADYFFLQDRSEGMRAFLALLAFVAGQPAQPRPILLVDEAETHLHYDAQAELVRMFEAQTAVSSVIYTTHSIGCLPQDLGRGVRVVEPTAEGESSSFKNGWWESGEGLSPLVIAMGATALSLVPARRAVFAEGPTDSMLLPTILREATNSTQLPFQILPAVSEASNDELLAMSRDAPEVAFLVDGDPAASKFAARLEKIGIDRGRILSLGTNDDGKPLVVEDLLDAETYVRAVNEELLSWPPHTGSISTTALPRSRRPDHVESICRLLGRQAPSKVQIAAEVLNQVMRPPDDSATPRLSDPMHDRRMKELLALIWSAVGLPGLPWDAQA